VLGQESEGNVGVTCVEYAGVMKIAYQTVIAGLRAELDKLDFERYSLVSFRGKPVMKRGFFPGGNGLFEGENAGRFPVGGTLVLGSNFSAASNFCHPDGRLICDDETSGKTWLPMRELFDGAELDLTDCFFTNAWPCLHAGTSNTLGKLIKKWLANPSLMHECAKFFAKTCADLKPSMIVALGPGPAAFVANVWPRELKQWMGNNIKSMDSLPIGVVQIEGVTHRTVCTAVVHPCYQHINAKHRKVPYRDAAGEMQLVKEADDKRKLLLHGFSPEDTMGL
jgi:hypothetical protein